MTADLPPIALGKSTTYGLEFVHQAESRTLFSSAVPSRTNYSNTEHLPEVTSNHPKRNSEGHMLQVKFVPRVVTSSIEKAKTAVPGFDSVLNVDHKHYEQWARVPGRRMTNNTLLRGIQQLKTRTKREIVEQERYELGIHNKDFQINQLNKNSLLTRDKLSDDNTMTALRRGERSHMSLDSAPRISAQPKSPMKTNAHVIYSGVFKEEDQDADEAFDQEKCVEPGSGEFTEHEGPKPRHGVSKIKNRCALPVSVYEPISIGDHVFLVNEPIKYTEFMKMRKTDYRLKKDPKLATVIIMPDKSGKVVHLPETTVPNQASTTGLNDSIAEGCLQRSRTLTGGFPPSRMHKRTPVMVSSAEIFDFSQMTEIKHLLDDKYLKRSETECSFPSKGGKYGKYPKWVPNVQRLKEKHGIKS